MPGITVSPTALFMGVVQPGQKVTKQLVVKGKKPFRILGRRLRRQVVPVRHLEGRAGEGIAPDPGDVHRRRRCGQGGQDDQDRDRPGRDDARVGGLRGGGRRTVSRLQTIRDPNVGAAVELPPLLVSRIVLLFPTYRFECSSSVTSGFSSAPARTLRATSAARRSLSFRPVESRTRSDIRLPPAVQQHPSPRLAK